jgi:ADP-ribosyl-[dinitrogen reductase] hydrolase
MTSTATDERDRFRGCLLGLAAGDAVGTTVEFRSRGSFRPLTDMVGGGPFHLPVGAWTDDTSLALCLATSLVETGRFNPRDQMERYVRWWRDGYLSSIGRCFDIGNTTVRALERFSETGDPFAGDSESWSAGNGSIMRLAPIPMFYFPDLDQTTHYAAESSRTTHGAAECQDACRLLARLLHRTLAGGAKEEILAGEADIPFTSPKIAAMATGDYRGKSAGQIRGGGYVVESLEAALWCFEQTASFEEAILAAANLGDDADTTAAVCGQLAAAHYGAASIPVHWRERLILAGEITSLADRLYDATTARA